MADEEDTIDPAIEIRERYGQSAECRVFAANIVECEKRVDGGSHEDCEEELYDFMSCVDKLVSCIFWQYCFLKQIKGINLYFFLNKGRSWYFR